LQILVFCKNFKERLALSLDIILVLAQLKLTAPLLKIPPHGKSYPVLARHLLSAKYQSAEP